MNFAHYLKENEQVCAIANMLPNLFWDLLWGNDESEPGDWCKICLWDIFVSKTCSPFCTGLVLKFEKERKNNPPPTKKKCVAKVAKSLPEKVIGIRTPYYNMKDHIIPTPTLITFCRNSFATVSSIRFEININSAFLIPILNYAKFQIFYKVYIDVFSHFEAKSRRKIVYLFF